MKLLDQGRQTETKTQTCFRCITRFNERYLVIRRKDETGGHALQTKRPGKLPTIIQHDWKRQPVIVHIFFYSCLTFGPRSYRDYRIKMKGVGEIII